MIKKLTRKLTEKSSSEKKRVSSRAKEKISGETGSEKLFSLIERRAFELYQKRGCIHGNDKGDWYEAEKAVLANLKK
jgi:hypothetical protein